MVSRATNEDKDEIPLRLLELIDAKYVDARSGLQQSLSATEKEYLVSVIKRNWGTRHMTLTELQLEAGLGHVSRGTIFQNLPSRGIKAYVEECKLILGEEGGQRRIVCYRSFHA